MTIIVPFGLKLIYNGKILSRAFTEIPGSTGMPVEIIPECRGLKLPPLKLYLSYLLGENVYIVDEEYMKQCLSFIMEYHMDAFDDILSKYQIDYNSINISYCFEELIRTTLDNYFAKSDK